MDRLGEDDMWSNFGSTLILGTVCFLVIILVIILLICIAKKVKLSAKNQERIRNLKRKVFWNAFIRYLLLNTLKFLMSASIILKQNKEDKVQMSLAIVQLIFLNTAPLFFARLLYKNRETLDDKEKSYAFTALYN